MTEIYVIEDDNELATLVEHMLKRSLGATVRCFSRAENAITAMEEGGEPDLFLVDLALPGVSGFEFISQIRKNPKTVDLPVLVVSARTELEDHARAIDVGADGYLEKPFNKKRLLVKVKSLLEFTQ